MSFKFNSKLCSAVIAAALTVNSMAVMASVANAADLGTYEFEDGTVTGAKSMSQTREGKDITHSGSGFIFLENAGEEASVTVNVAKTGMYNLSLSVYAPYGSKVQNLLINGVSQGTVAFSENDSFKDIALGMYKLNAGDNKITIQSSWGWSYIDCIKVSDGEFPELNVSNTLSDAKATSQTQSLMNYLTDVYGKNILSGQQEIYKYGPHDFDYEFNYIYNLSGEYPAIRGFDFLNCNPLYGSEDGTTDRIIDWVKNKNGIATASWHITVPKNFANYTLGDKVAWDQATYVPKETDFNAANVTVEGTKEHDYYMLCLKGLAEKLKTLQDANVPLIFRPLHEAEGSGGETGSWFWWGKSGSAVYKDIWKLTYDTLTNTYGLHNLIWEWNSYTYDTSTNWYPGENCVDMVGYDKYNCTDWSTGSAVLKHNDSAISGTFYNLVNQYGGKKLVAMAENDSVPTLSNIQTEKAGWLYFCPWYDGGSDNNNFLSNSVFNKPEDLKEIYQSDYCITLDELPKNLYSYTSSGEVTTASTTTASSETTVTTVSSASDTTSTSSGDVLLGDANCDKKVDISDVVAVRRFLVNSAKFSLTEQGNKNSDVSGNDGVNAQDAVKILQTVLGSNK